MKVNIVFPTVKIYDVGSRLDVVIGQEFIVELVDVEAGVPELFTNKDPILAIDADGYNVSAEALGESTLRFMQEASVVKDLVINVVAATTPNATTLGGTLGDPVPKKAPSKK